MRANHPGLPDFLSNKKTRHELLPSAGSLGDLTMPIIPNREAQRQQTEAEKAEWWEKNQPRDTMVSPLYKRSCIRPAGDRAERRATTKVLLTPASACELPPDHAAPDEWGKLNLDQQLQELCEAGRQELNRPWAEPKPYDADELKCINAILDEVANRRPVFPLWVFPELIRNYIETNARSIHCSPDLLAVPLLAVAGAAIGRSGRRLKVKDSWTTSSCVWTACLNESSGGKTPAMNAVQNFYIDRQAAEIEGWKVASQAHEDDPKNHPRPGPQPVLILTSTTVESLQADLQGGPALFARDELGGWCHEMGAYKSGNSDRYDWNSFWSHSAVNIGRKTTARVFVKEPFVGLTGMMVPASAAELNYRGHADDGLVHRMLLAWPEEMRPVASTVGVPEELTTAYKDCMTRLFDPPKHKGTPLAERLDSGTRLLTLHPKAFASYVGWSNEHLYGRWLYGPYRFFENGEWNPPGWLASKHRKLFENALRVSLVLHELWRVAASAEEKEDACDQPIDPMVIDYSTMERAEAVIEYFRHHIGLVQSALGHAGADAIDLLHQRLRDKRKVTVRQVIYQSSYKSKDQVLAVFAEWESRGYGKVSQPRANQTVFTFGEG
jgi:hypothetical protein